MLHLIDCSCVEPPRLPLPVTCEEPNLSADEVLRSADKYRAKAGTWSEETTTFEQAKIGTTRNCPALPNLHQQLSGRSVPRKRDWPLIRSCCHMKGSAYCTQTCLCRRSLYDASSVSGVFGTQEHVYLDVKIDVSMEKSVSLFPADTNTKRKLNTMDGACDAPDETSTAIQSRSCTLLPLQPQPARLSKVRFLSDDNLRSRRNSSIAPDVGTSRQQIGTFTNPFSDEGSSQSRRTSTSSDTTGYLRPNAFAGHRDTLARLPHSVTLHKCNGTIWEDESTSDDSEPMAQSLQFRRSWDGSPIDLVFPDRFIDSLLSYLTFEDYKNLRLVCRRWNSELPRPRFPAVHSLPQELLQQIYARLSPCDFDAARHACRAWYLASLDRNTQEFMLRVAGCRDALAADISRVSGSGAGDTAPRDSRMPATHSSDDFACDEEWICSKRLATESRLSSGWHGPPSGNDPVESRLYITDVVDFMKVLGKVTAPAKRVFTVSVCGRFSLVVAEGEILVYRLWDREQTIVPVVRLCPSIRVLEVGMDTSSDRYSVAALLEGRTGMLWDIIKDPPDAQPRSGPGEPLNLGLQTDVQSSASVPASRTLDFDLPMRSGELLLAAADDYEVSPLALLTGTSSPGFVPSPTFF